MDTIAIPAPKPATTHRAWALTAVDIVTYLRLAALRDTAPLRQRRTWRPA